MFIVITVTPVLMNAYMGNLGLNEARTMVTDSTRLPTRGLFRLLIPEQIARGPAKLAELAVSVPSEKLRGQKG